MVVVGKREVNGNGLVAQTNFDRDLVVQDQQAQLLAKVGRKKVWARQRGLIGTRPFHKAIGQLGVCVGHRCGLDAHKGVVGVHRGGGRLSGHKALHGGAQVLDLLAIQLLHMGQSLRGVHMKHAAAFMRGCICIRGHALLSL